MLPSRILPSPLCGVSWLPLVELLLTPPYWSSAVPSVKPFPRTTRPGMMLAPPPAEESTLCPAFVSYGRIVPRTFSDGNVIDALSIRTIS